VVTLKGCAELHTSQQLPLITLLYEKSRAEADVSIKRMIVVAFLFQIVIYLLLVRFG